MTKTVYQTALDGTYVGSIELDNSDVCPITGVYLIPGGCVEVEPPEPGEKQKVIWKNGEWELEDIQQQDPEPLTTEQKLANIRAKRDQVLDNTTWIFQRQQTGTEAQKLPAEKYQAWVDYWAALRDFPAVCDPDNPMWPEQPEES